MLVPKALPIVFAIAALSALVTSGRAVLFQKSTRPFVWLLASILIWGSISAFWAIEPRAALREAVVLLLAFLGALTLAAAGRSERTEGDDRLFRRALIAGYLLGLAVLGEELASGAWLVRRIQPGAALFYFNQGAAAVTLLVWPAALALVREGLPKAALLLFSLTLAVVGLGESESALGGLLVGGLAAIAARFKPKAALAAAAVLMGLGILAAPLLVRMLPTTETLSAHFTPRLSGLMPRITIWNYTADRIDERPLLGWGLNSSRFFSSELDKRVLDPNWRITSEPLPLHPHNAALQWWLELGFVGAALFTGLILLLCRRLSGPAALPWPTALALAQLSTAVAVACVGYGIWQGWWLAALSLNLAFTVHLRPAPTDER